MRDILVRGMLAGVLAALLATAFAAVVGEPPIEAAIAFEAAHEQAVTPGAVMPAGPVSRVVQRTAGLAAGWLLLGVAFGGLTAIAYAFAYGRLGTLDRRTTALLVALLAFAALYALPFLKYPPNPPAVGALGTIQQRTQYYVLMVLASVAV